VRRSLLAFLPVAAYAGIIFWLSSQPNPLPFLPREWLSQDKILHATEYAVLGAMLVVALRLAGLSPSRALVLAVVLASAYGASDEVHQFFVPGRSADVRDWVADTLGAALGAGLASRVLRRRGAHASIAG
jgi:VanZ family protein